MARKYYGSFYSVTGKLHRVEIWDDPSGSASGGTELKMSGNGYEIERNGQGSTFYDSPIRSSRSTSFWVMPSDTVWGEFKAIATNTEQYWAVLIYQDGLLIHVGRVVADQMHFKREAIEAKPTVVLAAVDGLELLDGFKVDATWFTDGKITIAQLFRRCLDELNLKDYWVINGTPTDYLRDAISPYSSDATRKGIDLLQVDLNTFVDNYDAFKDIKASDLSAFQYASNNMISCKQAIEQICNILQARFIHDIGRYWLVSAAEYLDATVAYRQYSYTLQYISSGTYTHAVQLGNDVRPQWYAKPTITYQPAAKYVQVDTERSLNAGVYRTFPNSSSTSLTSAFTDIPTGATPDEAPMRIRFALKFNRHVFAAASPNPAGPEDETKVEIKIWLTDGSGNIKILDNTNFYWVSGTAPVASYFETIKTDLQSTSWTSFVFDKNVSTAPAGFNTLHVEVTKVQAHKYTYNIFGIKAGSRTPFDKDYWGSIQIAFADASPYNNPDFTFNVTETYTPDTNSGLNSTPIILIPKYYYSANKYATGNIMANNGTTWVIADDWYGGWDSTTHGTPTEIMGKGFAGLYKDFVPVIQGTWIDAGALTAIKSLSFDERKWLLNGVVYSARSEQWDGEWLGLIPVYTGLTSTGEGLKVGSGLKDRVNYMDQQIGRLNDSVQRTGALVLDQLINTANGAPATVPTLNTQWEVMLNYDTTTETVAWRLQEHGSFKTYTVGTYTLDTNFEGALADCTAGSVTINLPAANTQKGKRYYFVKKPSSHNLRIDGAGANISGADHIDLSTNYSTATLICDGTEWFQIA